MFCRTVESCCYRRHFTCRHIIHASSTFVFTDFIRFISQPTVEREENRSINADSVNKLKHILHECDLNSWLCRSHFTEGNRDTLRAFTTKQTFWNDRWISVERRSSKESSSFPWISPEWSWCLDCFFFLPVASDHRTGAPDSRSLHLQWEKLQLLCVRNGEPSLYGQISLCLFHFISIM